MTTDANMAKLIDCLRGDCAGVRFDMDAYDPPNAGGIETVAFVFFHAARYTKMTAMQWSALKMGLDADKSNELFFADALDDEAFRKVTPHQAARCLSSLMKSGRVNWPAALNSKKTNRRKVENGK